MQVAAQAGCRCYGIEIRQDLHDIAKNIERNYNNVMDRRQVVHGEVHLVQVR